MEPVLSVKNLAKQYGKYEAVKGISFEVRPNEIFALIGPNGAGKSTTLKMISTILSASAGEINLSGVNALEQPEKIREMISYLPEESGAYKNLSGRGYLKFMAGIFADTAAMQKEYVEQAAAISGLGDRLDDKVNTYSKGMTRKLLLARALMTKPKLAILDEPTSGLDILNAVEIRKKIRDFTTRGVSVLLSSHNMLEIEYLSDRVAIIHKGQILVTGTCAELKERYQTENLEEVFAKVVS